MRGMNRHPVTALLSLVVLVRTEHSVASTAPAPSAPSSPGSSSHIRDPHGDSGAARHANTSAAGDPLSTQVASTGMVDTVAVTVVDGLRVRSEPRVSDDSRKLEPLLPLGSDLYASRGRWRHPGMPGTRSSRSANRPFRVAGSERRPGRRALDRAGPSSVRRCRPTFAPWRPCRAGSAWPASRGCPSRPMLAWSNATATWTAVVSPGWFLGASGSPELLVDPDGTGPPHDTGDWFLLNLDPNGQQPDVLPIGRYLGTSWSKPGLVEVTGMFDHPAAASCTMTEMDGEPAPTQDCRLAFAVTRLLAAGP